MDNPSASSSSFSSTLLAATTASSALSSALRPSIGPLGSLKLFRPSANEIRVTKKGSDIIKHLSIKHPTGVIVAQSASAQQSAAQDGTLSTVLLASALISESSSLLQRGLIVHPAILSSALSEANREAQIALRSLSLAAASGASSLTPLEIAHSILHATLICKGIQDPILLKSLFEAVTHSSGLISPSSVTAPLNTAILVQSGTHSSISFLPNQLVLDQYPRDPRSPSSTPLSSPARILITSDNFSPPIASPSAQGTYLQFSSASERLELTAAERKLIELKIDSVIKSAAHVLLCTGSIDAPAMARFAAANIIALREVPQEFAERVSRASQCPILPSIPIPTKEGNVDDVDKDGRYQITKYLGHAVRIYVDKKASFDGAVTRSIFEPGVAKCCTISIESPSSHSAHLLRSAFLDGISTARILSQRIQSLSDSAASPWILPGAGATEFFIASVLERKSKSALVSSPALSYALQVFSKALLSLPAALAASKYGNDRYGTSAAAQAVDSAYRLCSSSDLDSPPDSSPDWVWSIPSIRLGSNTGQKHVIDLFSVKSSSWTVAAQTASAILRVDFVARALPFGAADGKLQSQAQASLALNEEEEEEPNEDGEDNEEEEENEDEENELFSEAASPFSQLRQKSASSARSGMDAVSRARSQASFYSQAETDRRRRLEKSSFVEIGGMEAEEKRLQKATQQESERRRREAASLFHH